MVAAMTQALEIPKGARVLEIGTGTGYQTAVLAHIAAEVWTVERDPVLASEAKGRLDDLGLKQVRVRVGDGSIGWKEGSPYQGILVTAGAPKIPPSLIEQLAPRGCLVIPTGPHDQQRLLRVTLNPDGTILARKTLMKCRFVPLIGHEGWRGEESWPPDVAP
jgi:protein-L-isoaspartate(D-aspartate) O-methyltransferase